MFRLANSFSVEDILLDHWRKYGRTYNMRYDYESVDSEDASTFMINLQGMALDVIPRPDEVARMDEFEYKDPIDGSVAASQGIRVVTSDGDRFVVRLSGTGSAGATIRVYFEKYEPASPDMGNKDPKEVFKDLVEFAVGMIRVEEMTERDAPTVIT